MAQVLIRNPDEGTVAAYREAAERNDRSLEAELRGAPKAMRPRTKAQVGAQSVVGRALEIGRELDHPVCDRVFPALAEVVDG